MDYKDTLNLPKTKLPMKANLVLNEPKILASWQKNNLTEKIYKQNIDRPKYTLHDGPPYANGHIHIGHALNKILKDIIIKSKTMSGYYSLYVPGWDCHGLPIEHQVDKKLGSKRFSMDKADKRKRCREYAKRFVDIQRDEFIRLGVFGRWDKPYLTMDYEYEAAIVREFAKFVERGLVYKGVKPIHWCSSCTTALAEAEVEYADHSSSSIYVAFSLNKDSQQKLGLDSPVSAVIWTTTPWTLPANLAVCLHPDYTYAAVKAGGQIYILAKDLMADALAAMAITDYSVIAEYKGAQLEGLSALHPFIQRESKIILGRHVTLEQGTGCVHTAPGHGQEDYDMGLKYNLEIYSPVNDRGNFTDEVEDFGGMNVFKANQPVIDKLSENGKLLANRMLTHSYPHCWRCKKPVIFRATPQWFVSLDKADLRRRSLDAINKVQWIPDWGRERIYNMMDNRPDWCLSRQRSWGIPIMAFYCEACNYSLLDPHIINQIAGRVVNEGTDIWFTDDVDMLMGCDITCPECGGRKWRKDMDILDVWFDSGVSHAAVIEPDPGLDYPAQLYLEGSDQHRGWFNSSLITAVAVRDSAPYRAVLTHGFVVDSKGKKMSKSAGNVIAPQQVINKYGAEILRLWVTGEDYRSDVKISPEILKRLVDAYRRIRNTCRYMLGNLNDFAPQTDKVEYEQLDELDKWALHRLQKLIKRIKDAYNEFTFHNIYHQLHNFCTVELSGLYLDVLKDRLYCSAADDKARRAAQTVLMEVLLSLLKLMAPALCFSADEIWRYLPAGVTDKESVHLALFPDVNEAYIDEALAVRWDKLLDIRKSVCAALELARKPEDGTKGFIGSGLQAQVTLYLSAELKQFLTDYSTKYLSSLFIVSSVVKADLGDFTDVPHALSFKSEEMNDLAIGIDHAQGDKCERCWMYSNNVQIYKDNGQLCPRCAVAVRAL